MGQSEKQRLWKLNHYSENKNFYISKQSERRKLIKEFLDNFKKSGCVVCGGWVIYNSINILEFFQKNY